MQSRDGRDHQPGCGLLNALSNACCWSWEATAGYLAWLHHSCGFGGPVVRSAKQHPVNQLTSEGETDSFPEAVALNVSGPVRHNGGPIVVSIYGAGIRQQINVQVTI